MLSDTGDRVLEFVGMLKRFILRISEDNLCFEPSFDVPIMEMGLDSLELVELRSLIYKKLSLALPATVFFQYRTIQDLAEHLSQITGQGHQATVQQNTVVYLRLNTMDYRKK